VELQDRAFTKPEVERRRYRRVKLVTQVHSEAMDRSEIMVSSVVSAGGMFINVGKPLAVGSELALTFRISPTAPAIVCRGGVTFSRVGFGMGIKFLDLDPEIKQTLERFVDQVA
jgi:c-di-GMP-binding flagellar brake protein YcgR